MEATTYSDFRRDLKHYLDKVNDDCESIVVTRKNQRNAVVISEDTYNNILENQFVLGNPANHKWLDQSWQQFKNGHAKKHDLIDNDHEQNFYR